MDLAISMHKSSLNYYLRRLHPRLKDMAITSNTILNVFHMNEDIVKWIETFISTISSALLRIFEMGLWECKKASEERIAQTKRKMNPKFNKLPRIFLLLLTIFQVCSSTVSSGFQIFQHGRDPSQEWFFNWDLENCPDLEIEEEPKNSGEAFYYNNKGEVICFPAIIEPGLVLNNTIGEEVYTEDFEMGSGNTEFGTDNCATHHICYEKSLFCWRD